MATTRQSYHVRIPDTRDGSAAPPITGSWATRALPAGNYVLTNNRVSRENERAYWARASGNGAASAFTQFSCDIRGWGRYHPIQSQQRQSGATRFRALAE